MSHFKIHRKDGRTVTGNDLTSWNVDKHVLTVICGEEENEVEVVVPFSDVDLFFVAPQIEGVDQESGEMVH